MLKLKRVSCFGFLMALSVVGCKEDCADGLVIEKQTITEQYGPFSLECGGTAGNCRGSLLWSRNVTYECVRPKPETPPSPEYPVPNVSTYNPLEFVRYQWNYASSLAILERARVDLAGSTVPFANSGTGLIVAYDHSGAPSAALVTNWTRAGSEIALSNTASVARWMASQSSACGYHVKVDLGVPLPRGLHNIAVEAKFNGQTVMAGSRQFFHNGQPFEAIALELE